MSSSQKKPLHAASDADHYSDEKAALVDHSDHSIQDEDVIGNTDAVDEVEPHVGYKSGYEDDYKDDYASDKECDDDTMCAQPLETTIAIESIGPDEVVATLETTEPEAIEFEPSTPSLISTATSVTQTQASDKASVPDSGLIHQNAKQIQSQNFEAMAKISQEEADAEVTVSDSDSETTNAEVSSETNDTKRSNDQDCAIEQAEAAVEPSPLTDSNIRGNKLEGTPESMPEKNINTSADEVPVTEQAPTLQKDGSDIEKDVALDKTDPPEDQEEEEVQEKKEAKLESYKQFVAEQFSNQKVDYPEVRVRIEANALPSKMYFIMNILSAIIASYGLVTNSAAVVIGAMLVAMMLGPITGVALALIDHRMPLLRKSLFTVIAGVSLVVLVGFLVGWLHKDQPLTAEILSRTQPTSMDLMIALAGGTAGAYAMVSPHLSVAVVGVAVATALVPPLAASGILFANGEMQLGLGALLLAFTNIIAIQFTNALVLWLLGFRRLVDDDYKSSTYLTFLRRNAVTLLLLAGLGAYLTINLQTNAKQQVFESSVKEAINSYFIDKGNVLTNTQFDTSEENKIVRAVIRGETTPTSYDVRQIETVITQDMAEHFPEYLPIKLQLRYLPVQVIESDPLITDKLDKTDAAILTN